MIQDLFRHLRIHTATKPKQVKNTGTFIDKIKKVKDKSHWIHRSQNSPQTDFKRQF